MAGTREELVFMARLAEQAERFEDMVAYMKQVASMGARLEPEERNLLSAAYKNVVGSRRAAWRAISVAEIREAPESAPIIQGYKQEVQAELDAKCQEVIQLLGDTLIRLADEGESKVFFMKMKGDYYRYAAEFKTEELRNADAEQARAAYSDALQVSETSLSPGHPIRLGLALNFSVFHNEVMGNAEQAISLARDTVEQAIPALEPGQGLTEDQRADSEQIVHLLRDNLVLWMSGGGGAGEDGTAVEEL